MSPTPTNLLVKTLAILSIGFAITLMAIFVSYGQGLAGVWCTSLLMINMIFNLSVLLFYFGKRRTLQR